ncbi:T7SS effector LXG polymorphic toxin [Listeria seeligeri]|uniref:T7SS effector LXG polymorphic toxin n=1 Tax=Listeria seeligeri TaxID=1640 RepID=UPI0022EBF0E0|nr:T7SS effector LXG polymorphic toxin [Listeria seeligeri]
MSRIDIAELNDFLHGLRTSNAEAKGMIRKIKEAAMDYTQDNSLKGAAVSTSKSYFSSTYTSITQSILEALDESEERLAQYIREFGDQVDSSPSCKIDAQVLQEVMDKVSQLQRKEETLQEQLTAPNTRPDMQEVYAVKTKSAHTQLLKAIEKENILEKYIAFEQSHGSFFSALAELIRATGQAVQELLDKVTFNEQTGTYSIPKSTTSSLQRMKKALDTARTENDKDPYPESFEDYTLLAYTYVNDRGETVTMWLLEKDGKRANNKELQAFLEEHGNDLNPVLYTELSGEELERKVNDAWKEGVNYLNGQKVSGPSAGILKTSAYAASMKDAMDDAGLTDMAMSLGFGIAAARNAPILKKEGISSSAKMKANPPESKQAVSGEKWNNYFKEKYGAKNVQWKPTSFDDIVANPERLYGSTKKEISKMLGEGWKEGTYGSTGKGWKFTNEGDGMVFYHPGEGIHSGSYYGFSTGDTGKVKIVGENYIDFSSDKATIIKFGGE